MQILPGLFPNKEELARVNTLKKYQDLYDLKHLDVFGVHSIIKNQYKKESDLVYLAHSIPSRISEFYGEFVQGDTARMVIDSSIDTLKEYVKKTVYENDLKEMIFDIACDQSEFGYAVLYGFKDSDGVFKIQLIGQDQYFPQADGSVILATYKRNPKDITQIQWILYTQTLWLEGEDVHIKREAWSTDEKGVAIQAYSFDALRAILNDPNLKEEEILQGVGDLPIKQIDNGKRNRWGFGKSDYADILSQLSEINERASHISCALLKNLDSKLVIPRTALDEKGQLRYAETYVLDSKDDPKPEYISNSNPFFGEARAHIESETKWISWITAVPMFELLKSSMPERVESLRIQLFAATRKTTTKRAKLRRALNDLLRIGARMNGLEVTDDFIINFSDVLPVDEYVMAQTEQLKVQTGLSSKRASMKRIENYNDEQADAELALIDEESKISGLGEPSNAPII